MYRRKLLKLGAVSSGVCLFPSKLSKQAMAADTARIQPS